MPAETVRSEPTGVDTAVRHALGWLVVGNSVGLALALWLMFPQLQLGEWSYGRWVPVHLNVQLFGWTSLPLVAWLLHIYEVDRSKLARWAPAAVWAWTAALAAGALQWLGGRTSGKIFLDWQGGALWGLVVAMAGLWLVLTAACRERSAAWTVTRRRLAWAGVAVLAAVPPAMVYAASPKVYPPVDVTTGGPTGASLLGSTLIVVTLMMLLPRAGAASGRGRAGWGVWTYLVNCWLVFVAAEWIGGTHFQFHQIGAMALLLPWAWLVPWDWAGFTWPEGTRGWRRGVFGWWGLLVLTGVTMYLPGLLDRIKFTQGLVAHSHLAMAGFTTSFCALVLVALTGRRLGGGRAVAAWHGAALAMVLVLAGMGWAEGGGYSWMLENPWWRTAGMHFRACCGAVLLGASVVWLRTCRRYE
jgi:cytochrome c oxidase cbb3-type subunit 1